MGGDATVGTISIGGNYEAPAAVPSPATVTVTATSIEDPTKSGAAEVAIIAAALPPPTLSPQPSPEPQSDRGGGGGAAMDLLALLVRCSLRSRESRAALLTVRHNCLQLACGALPTVSPHTHLGART